MAPQVAFAGEGFGAVGTGELVCGCHHVVVEGLGSRVLVVALHTAEVSAHRNFYFYFTFNLTLTCLMLFILFYNLSIYSHASLYRDAREPRNGTAL